MPDRKENNCVHCNLLNCYRKERRFPDFCLTTAAEDELLEETLALYKSDEQNNALALAAANIEGRFYGKMTRVEEIIAFAKACGMEKIGIATCLGLMNEAKLFARIVRVKGLRSHSVICKVGAVDKTTLQIPEELKIKPGGHESICNPILQAELLNRQNTDLNVIVGLCVGHDALFAKYSAAPVTTLITKDRVLGHNPAAALYTSGFYYKKLLQKDK